MKRLWNTIAGLRLGFEEHFRGAGSISLFVGLACNLAFVGQVYFWPSMWHTTAFMFSYTDASYVAELLCALMLGWRLRRGGRLVVGSRLLWVLALLVQATLVLYCALFGAGIHVPEPVNWVCGAIFGVYLPVAMTSWFAVHIDRRSFSVIWNIVLAGVFASFVIWVFSGLEAVKLCVCMGVLMFVGTFVLSRKLRTEQAKEGDDAAAPAAVPADTFRYPASATFLFSFSFITAIAFAGIGGDSASYASGDFFAPMLLICAVVLLANAAVLPLTTIAVPAIIVAVIAASYLHLEPALSFDLAALGMFLFLAYAVVLLCASAQGTRRHTLAAFTGLMVAFAAGCLVGRPGHGALLRARRAIRVEHHGSAVYSGCQRRHDHPRETGRHADSFGGAFRGRAGDGRSRCGPSRQSGSRGRRLRFGRAREGGAHAALRGVLGQRGGLCHGRGQRHGEVAHPPRLQEARRPQPRRTLRETRHRERREKRVERRNPPNPRRAGREVAEGVPRAVH